MTCLGPLFRCLSVPEGTPQLNISEGGGGGEAGSKV